MADGKIVVQAEVDAKKAQRELDKLTARIDKLETDLKKSSGEQSGIKAQLDAAKESAKQAETALKSLLETTAVPSVRGTILVTTRFAELLRMASTAPP